MEDLHSKIIKEYVDGEKTMNDISNMFNIDCRKVSKILKDNNIEKRAYRKTEETKRKISKALSGKTSPLKGRPLSISSRYNNMRAQFKLDESTDLSIYSDFNRLKKITEFISKNIPKEPKNPSYIISFIDKFYNDAQFNKIYDLWISSGMIKWLKPSLDHIVPISRGGDHNIDNLQVLTWFENRCKVDMLQEEWEEFKKTSGTSSDYFI